MDTSPAKATQERTDRRGPGRSGIAVPGGFAVEWQLVDTLPDVVADTVPTPTARTRRS